MHVIEPVKLEMEAVKTNLINAKTLTAVKTNLTAVKILTAVKTNLTAVKTNLTDVKDRQCTKVQISCGRHVGSSTKVQMSRDRHMDSYIKAQRQRFQRTLCKVQISVSSPKYIQRTLSKVQISVSSTRYIQRTPNKVQISVSSPKYIHTPIKVQISRKERMHCRTPAFYNSYSCLKLKAIAYLPSTPYGPHNLPHMVLCTKKDLIMPSTTKEIIEAVSYTHLTLPTTPYV